MSAASIQPTILNLNADRHMARWRPFVQWILAIPHLLVVRALQTIRGLLTLVSLITVVFTRRIPRPLFDAIAMTYRYEWRTVSYALFLHGDYPPFDFMPSALDDGQQPTGSLTFAYPEHLNRWKPLYKWFLAIPHYVVCIILAIASVPRSSGEQSPFSSRGNTRNGHGASSSAATATTSGCRPTSAS